MSGVAVSGEHEYPEQRGAYAEMEREVSRWRDEASLYMRLWSRLLDLAGQALVTGDDVALRAHLDQYRSGWADEASREQTQ